MRVFCSIKKIRSNPGTSIKTGPFLSGSVTSLNEQWIEYRQDNRLYACVQKQVEEGELISVTSALRI
ncbi:hypothetical protein V1477_003061 [Vespula maculifrons]